MENMKNRFDNSGWGIYLPALNDAEETCRRVGEDWGLTEEAMNEVEERAKQIVERSLRTNANPLKNLTSLIVCAKAEALIEKMCMTDELDPSDFDISYDGGLVILYQEKVL